VVIPTYRRPELLAKCLDALRGQTLDASSFEVCVVDDASGDATPTALETASRAMPNLRWASQPANRGPAAARNRAVSLGTGALLVFIDDDVVASPTLLADHLALHRAADAPIAVVGHLTWAPGLPVTRFMRWLDDSRLQFSFETMPEGEQEDVVNSFYTCNLSLPRTAFEAVGGFNERFPFPACEDSDLGLRITADGLKLFYRPQVVAWHSRPVTLPEFRDRMIRAAQSWQLLAQLHPDRVPVITPARVPRRMQRWAYRNAAVVLAAVLPDSRNERFSRVYFRTEMARALDIGAAAGPIDRAA
jgi:GT2 family glycosyltransferase